MLRSIPNVNNMKEKLMRVLLDALLRLVDTDQLQHFDRAGKRFLALAVRMQLNSLTELVADGKDRVQARHRILKR